MLNDILKPLKLLGIAQKYNLKITVLGGGKASQVDAIILGISRALLLLDETFRETTLKEMVF